MYQFLITALFILLHLQMYKQQTTCGTDDLVRMIVFATKDFAVKSNLLL